MSGPLTSLQKRNCFLLFLFALFSCLLIIYFESSVLNLNYFVTWNNNQTDPWLSQRNALTAWIRKPIDLSPSRNSSVTEPDHTTLKELTVTTVPPEKLEICTKPGRLTYDLTENVTASEVFNKTAIDRVKPGGRFEPKNCRPMDHVAIIVPYRNRLHHREILLNHLHNFLQRQMIKYDVYLIEPSAPLIFNRGLLCNIGFNEAISRYNYTCIVVHDIDLLPLNSDNNYVCDVNARHLATESSKNKFKLPYPSYLGGVVAIKRQFFEQLNGFSNVFFGWGGEDDDLLMRIQMLTNHKSITRNAKGLGRYLALPHVRDRLNEENPLKFKLYKTSKTRFRQEGLNTLNYSIVETRLEKLYTWINVSYNKSQIMQAFERKWGLQKAENITSEKNYQRRRQD